MGSLADALSSPRRARVPGCFLPQKWGEREVDQLGSTLFGRGRRQSNALSGCRPCLRLREFDKVSLDFPVHGRSHEWMRPHARHCGSADALRQLDTVLTSAHHQSSEWPATVAASVSAAIQLASRFPQEAQQLTSSIPPGNSSMSGEAIDLGDYLLERLQDAATHTGVETDLSPAAQRSIIQGVISVVRAELENGYLRLELSTEIADLLITTYRR